MSSAIEAGLGGASLPEEPAKSRTQWGKGPPPPEVARFLQGPQPRGFELARALGIFWEVMRDFRTLHFVGPCVTVFGSARFTEDQPYYRLAREVGARLARAGFTVMTGGGPGIMEAANRGAKDAGGRSVGCNIELPREQRPNPYLDRRYTDANLTAQSVIELFTLIMSRHPRTKHFRIYTAATRDFPQNRRQRAERREDSMRRADDGADHGAVLVADVGAQEG